MIEHLKYIAKGIGISAIAMSMFVAIVSIPYFDVIAVIIVLISIFWVLGFTFSQ